MRQAFFVVLLVVASCAPESEHDDVGIDSDTSHLTTSDRMDRYARIRDAAVARGIGTGYLLAGIAFTESGLAQCWSEAQWACAGPRSPDCNGGPVIAGSADGACSAQQGGLGMFQFDAGTFADTLRVYGNDVLTIDGQVAHAIDYVVEMVRMSAYTTNAETTAKARDWVRYFDPNDAVHRDQWIKTVLRYYNGCDPGWSCWGPRYQTYSDGLATALRETNGPGFWRGGTTCPGGRGAVVGAIEAHYRELGGCGSFLGAPITEEMGTPDGVGRYSVFEHGSIYWTAQVGAHEVHGVIRDKWRDLGWEAGPLGYPITDEVVIPGGKKSTFEHGVLTSP